MYELAIETDYILPTGEIDAVLIYDENYSELLKIAERFIESGYRICVQAVHEE